MSGWPELLTDEVLQRLGEPGGDADQAIGPFIRDGYPELATWSSRSASFGQLTKRLEPEIHRSGPRLPRGVFGWKPSQSRLRKKLTGAYRLEYLLDLLLQDEAVPQGNLDAAVRYVVEDRGLVSLPGVGTALFRLSFESRHDSLRRLAWYATVKATSARIKADKGRRLPWHVFRKAVTEPKAAPIFTTTDIEVMKEASIASRGLLGPRGTLGAAARPEPGLKSVELQLWRAFAVGTQRERTEAVVAIGDLGGASECGRLCDALVQEVSDPSDGDLAVHLIGAIATIGGPQAVETLLRVLSDCGGSTTERDVRLAKVILASLEFLVTGTTGLLEFGEPSSAQSQEVRAGAVELIDHLNRVAESHTAAPIVARKAADLMEHIRAITSDPEPSSHRR